MDEQKKEQIKKGYNKLLEVLIKYGCNETVAKVVTGAVIGILVALFMTSCDTITPTQIHTVHDLYHKVTDEPCIFVVKDYKK